MLRQTRNGLWVGKPTHEDWINAVAQLGLARLAPEERAKFDGVKLVYGAGQPGVMGVTMFNKWHKPCGEVAAFIEIAAFTHADYVTMADTVLHEIGHGIAGFEAGHGPEWRACCERLGLRNARAAGRSYRAALAPDLRTAIEALPLPYDGRAKPGVTAPLFGPLPPRPACTAGVGSKGGKSRGPGSGSRLRLFVCEGIGHRPYKVRIAADEFAAHCTICNAAFKRG